MVEPREPSHPPSDPHSGLSRGSGAGFVESDRPSRTQLVAALLAGLVLVASGLYVWRRPHTPGDGTASESGSTSALAPSADEASAPLVVVDAGASAPVTLSEARVLGCHDKGPVKTLPDQCDRLSPIEQALARAIEQSAACVPSSTGSGSIEYVADVSFLRRKVHIVLPRAGRSVRDRKVVTDCAAAVRGGMQSVALDSVEHHHARYKISVTATYRGKG